MPNFKISLNSGKDEFVTGFFDKSFKVINIHTDENYFYNIQTNKKTSKQELKRYHFEALKILKLDLFD